MSNSRRMVLNHDEYDKIAGESISKGNLLSGSNERGSVMSDHYVRQHTGGMKPPPIVKYVLLQAGTEFQAPAYGKMLPNGKYEMQAPGHKKLYGTSDGSKTWDEVQKNWAMRGSYDQNQDETGGSFEKKQKQSIEDSVNAGLSIAGGAIGGTAAAAKVLGGATRLARGAVTGVRQTVQTASTTGARSLGISAGGLLSRAGTSVEMQPLISTGTREVVEQIGGRTVTSALTRGVVARTALGTAGASVVAHELSGSSHGRDLRQLTESLQGVTHTPPVQTRPPRVPIIIQPPPKVHPPRVPIRPPKIIAPPISRPPRPIAPPSIRRPIYPHHSTLLLGEDRSTTNRAPLLGESRHTSDTYALTSAQPHIIWTRRRRNLL